MSDTKNNNLVSNFYRASAEDFKRIPGSPIAFWIEEKLFQLFNECPFNQKFLIKQGLASGDNNQFFRFLWEVDSSKIGFYFDEIVLAWKNNVKWFPLNKGGGFRKWYGNRDYLLSFDKDNRDLLKKMGNNLPSENYYLKSSVSWSDITSSKSSFRYYEKGFIFNNKGNSIFFIDENEKYALLS